MANKNAQENRHSAAIIKQADRDCLECEDPDQICQACLVSQTVTIALMNLTCNGCRHNEACTDEPETCKYWF